MARQATEVAKYRKVLVRLPEDLIKTIQSEAFEQERSFNGQLVYELRSLYGTPRERQRREAPTAP